MKKKKDIGKNVFATMSPRTTQIFFALCSLIIVGIYYSTAVVTACMIGLVVLSIRFITIKKLSAFFIDYEIMPLVMIFILVFLSGGNSEDQQEWATAVRVKLPFLILPLAVYMLPAYDVKKVLYLHYWLIATSVLVGLPVFFNALVHYDDMMLRLAQGQYIPAPIEHVKYSMFNAYAVMAGVILINHQSDEPTYLKIFSLTGTVFVFILMHLLAVRTGLVILYVSLSIYGLCNSYERASKKYLARVLIFVTLLPLVMYNTVPTIQKKIDYMRYDWAKYRNNQGSHYSDSERIMSYKAGWALFKSAPFMGVGYGDVRKKSYEYYNQQYNRTDLYKLPHSQYLLTLCGGGILGMAIFVSGFFTPLIHRRQSSVYKTLLIFLYLNYSISFLVENSLERSMSVAFFLVLALPLLKSIKIADKGEVNI